MSKDEALRLALEALESTGENNGYHGVTQYFDETMVDQAITAIKAALEAKDEPVGVNGLTESETNSTASVFGLVNTTPPPVAEPHKRKPLTDEEIWKFWWNKPEVPEGEDDSMEAQFVSAVRAVLAAHGIKGAS